MSKISNLLLVSIVGWLLGGCAADFDTDENPTNGKADSLGFCGDGSFALCSVVPDACPSGTVREIVGHCFGECVDPSTCQPPMEGVCGDGTLLVGEPEPRECPLGEVREVVNGRFGGCVDATTCEAPKPQDQCGDGTIAICEILPFDCPAGTVREVIDECFGECVDPLTCEPPAEAACQGENLEQMSACAQACADVEDIFAFSDCLGDACPTFFTQLDTSGEDCMNCSFLRGEDHANESMDEIGAGDAFLFGVTACSTESTPL